MWTTSPPLNLLRYLFAVRVNSSLVRLPRCPSMEFSLVLGSILTERLSSREARPWHKAQLPWQGYHGEILPFPQNHNTPQQNRAQRNQANREQSQREFTAVPEIIWPLDLVIHVYPGKTTYGQGEIILWEMKIFGRDADHRLFLERLLPAVEEAGITRNRNWRQPSKLWGNFDIEAVSVARGLQWEPIVQAGTIDLKTFPTPMQWAEGLPFTQNAEKPLSKLTWLTPYAFEQTAGNGSNQRNRGRRRNQRRRVEPPTLETILAATAQRLSSAIPIWQAQEGDTSETTEPAEIWQAVRQRAQRVRLLRNELQTAPKNWPGQGFGEQTFDLIPPELEPYLTLASILHVGQYRHFGCGTFMLSV